MKSSSYNRVHIPVDRRHLLFQSLASIFISGKGVDSIAARERAKRNTNDIPVNKYAGINYDGDGDEIFHDTLDILFSTKSRPSPVVGPVRRAIFRGLVKPWQF